MKKSTIRKEGIKKIIKWNIFREIYGVDFDNLNKFKRVSKGNSLRLYEENI